MKRSCALSAVLVSLTCAPVAAGPDAVKLPADYQARFVNYLDVDHHDRKRVRKMWVNPEAHAAAVAGQPMPDGTVLVMEDHDAKVDADGNLVFGDDGRLIPVGSHGNRFVMEKNAAWVTDNGSWDYAWYQADGIPRADAKYEGCFACHANRTSRDYTFTYWKYLVDKSN